MGQEAVANLRGSSSPDFQIGKRGPRIFQGTVDPNVLVFVGEQPTDGDLFIQHGTTTEALWQLIGGTWIQFASALFGADYQMEEDLALTSTTQSTFQTKVSLTTPALTGTYLVGWSASLSNTDEEESAGARLQNITDAVTLSDEVQHGGRHDDVHRTSVGGFAEVVFTGALKTFELQFNRPSFSTDTAEIRQARLEFWRVS